MASSAAAAAGGGGAAPAPVYKSNLEPGIADIILRSRQTILDILDDRGYDSAAYRNIAPEQILTLAEANPWAMTMIVPKRADSNAPCERAAVVYILQDRIRLRLGTFKEEVYKAAAADPAGMVRESDDLIVILNEPYHEAFDKLSITMWQEKKARMVFFHIKQLVIHPGKHVLVPPHRKLTEEEVTEVMTRLHVKNKSQFPVIKHDDIQSRLLGLVPGDMVEIQRPSPTAGIATFYRVCMK